MMSTAAIAPSHTAACVPGTGTPAPPPQHTTRRTVVGIAAHCQDVTHAGCLGCVQAFGNLGRAHVGDAEVEQRRHAADPLHLCRQLHVGQEIGQPARMGEGHVGWRQRHGHAMHTREPGRCDATGQVDTEVRRAGPAHLAHARGAWRAQHQCAPGHVTRVIASRACARQWQRCGTAHAVREPSNAQLLHACTRAGGEELETHNGLARLPRRADSSGDLHRGARAPGTLARVSATLLARRCVPCAVVAADTACRCGHDHPGGTCTSRLAP